jgi:hypothetical protein
VEVLFDFLQAEKNKAEIKAVIRKILFIEFNLGVQGMQIIDCNIMLF